MNYFVTIYIPWNHNKIGCKYPYLFEEKRSFTVYFFNTCINSLVKVLKVNYNKFIALAGAESLKSSSILGPDINLSHYHGLGHGLIITCIFVVKIPFWWWNTAEAAPNERFTISKNSSVACQVLFENYSPGTIILKPSFRGEACI